MLLGASLRTLPPRTPSDFAKHWSSFGSSTPWTVPDCSLSRGGIAQFELRELQAYAQYRPISSSQAHGDGYMDTSRDTYTRQASSSNVQVFSAHNTVRPLTHLMS